MSAIKPYEKKNTFFSASKKLLMIGKFLGVSSPQIKIPLIKRKKSEKKARKSLE